MSPGEILSCVLFLLRGFPNGFLCCLNINQILPTFNTFLNSDSHTRSYTVDSAWKLILLFLISKSASGSLQKYTLTITCKLQDLVNIYLLAFFQVIEPNST